MLDVAFAPDLQLLAPSAFAAPLLALSSAYATETGRVVDFTWGPVSGVAPDSLLARIRDGYPADGAVLPKSVLKQAMSEAGPQQEEVRELFVTCIAAAVPADAPTPPLDDLEQLERFLLSARAIGISAASSGQFIKGTILAGFESGDVLQSRTVTFEHVGRAVASGAVSVGFQQGVELANVPNTKLLTLPAAARNPTTICLTALAKPRSHEGMENFARFVRGKAGAEIVRGFGLTP